MIGRQPTGGQVNKRAADTTIAAVSRAPLGNVDLNTLHHDEVAEQPRAVLKPNKSVTVNQPMVAAQSAPVQPMVASQQMVAAPILNRSHSQSSVNNRQSVIFPIVEEISSPMEVEPVPAYRDIDIGDEVNPQLCTAYVPEIYEHLRLSEGKLRPKTCYLADIQNDINMTMRAILVDWLVEVAEEYRLSSDTLYLTVSFIDRFLSVTPVVRARLQLVGITCCLIAAKYEEIYAPAVDEFVYISDNTYTREEIIRTESLILNTLEFQLTTPTAKLFLRRFIKAAEADPQTAMLASFICELGLQEYSMIKYLPSLTAAASVSLALCTGGFTSWNPTLEFYTSYSQADLLPCVNDMYAIFAQAPNNNLQAVRDKYSQSRFLRVGLRTPPAVYH